MKPGTLVQIDPSDRVAGGCLGWVKEVRGGEVVVVVPVMAWSGSRRDQIVVDAGLVSDACSLPDPPALASSGDMVASRVRG